MGRFDQGVSSYTFAEGIVEVAFPEDEVKCKWCKFMTHNDGLNRDKCFLTGEILFSRELIGQKCPLTVINEVKTEDLK